MEKIYITNPSTSLNMTWSLIESYNLSSNVVFQIFYLLKDFLDDRTKAKINKIGKKEYSKIFEYIPGDQLEMQYGGTMENIKNYWPPIDPLKHLKAQLSKEKDV